MSPNPWGHKGSDTIEQLTHSELNRPTDSTDSFAFSSFLGNKDVYIVLVLKRHFLIYLWIYISLFFMLAIYWSTSKNFGITF